MQRTCQLTMPARPAGIDQVHDLVQSLWTGQACLPGPDKMRFETAVIEVASNIVSHGTRMSGGHEVIIELTLTAGPDCATAQFRDDGSAAEVDLTTAQMPCTTAESGRGLALTRALTDRLTYERAGPVNIWTLTCRRRSGQGAEGGRGGCRAQPGGVQSGRGAE